MAMGADNKTVDKDVNDIMEFETYFANVCTSLPWVQIIQLAFLTNASCIITRIFTFHIDEFDIFSLQQLLSNFTRN
jgi:hypothetical protein